jgi:hypothetical protein
MTKSELIQAELKQQQATQTKQRRGCWAWINAKTLEGALDPLFLAFSLCVSLAALAAGIWTIIRSAAFSGITVGSWDDFTQVCRMLWRWRSAASVAVQMLGQQSVIKQCAC